MPIIIGAGDNKDHQGREGERGGQQGSVANQGSEDCHGRFIKVGAGRFAGGPPRVREGGAKKKAGRRLREFFAFLHAICLILRRGHDDGGGRRRRKTCGCFSFDGGERRGHGGLPAREGAPAKGTAKKERKKEKKRRIILRT